MVALLHHGTLWRCQCKCVLMHRSPTGWFYHTGAWQSLTKLISRTAMKALKMSIIHVVAFVISWTPCIVMGTWSQPEQSKHLEGRSGLPLCLSVCMYVHTRVWHSYLFRYERISLSRTRCEWISDYISIKNYTNMIGINILIENDTNTLVFKYLSHFDRVWFW